MTEWARLHAPVAALMREAAARFVLPRFRTLAAHEIREKTPGDLVTIADHESEAFLYERLSRLLPESRVVGEEAVAADPALLDRLDEGLVWLVDPLDGTLNFSEGRSPFAVMVALLTDGERTAAWILDPLADRLCQAERSGGTFIDGERVRASETGAPLPLAAIAPYFLPPDQQADIEARAAGRMTIVAIPRCAGEQYPRLILGQNDITLFEHAKPWDHAAGALMLEEAGGRIARTDGAPYSVAEHRPRLIAAASPRLWDEAAEVLFG